jgi:thiol-disulfide isomerase/thioredoxin
VYGVRSLGDRLPQAATGAWGIIATLCLGLLLAGYGVGNLEASWRRGYHAQAVQQYQQQQIQQYQQGAAGSSIPGNTPIVPGVELLYFTAKWCALCKQMAPIIERIKAKWPAARTIDVDEEPGIADQYGVRLIPACVVVANGKVVEHTTGAQTESQLFQMMDRVFKSSAPAVASTQCTVTYESGEFYSVCNGIKTKITVAGFDPSVCKCGPNCKCRSTSPPVAQNQAETLVKDWFAQQTAAKPTEWSDLQK